MIDRSGGLSASQQNHRESGMGQLKGRTEQCACVCECVLAGQCLSKDSAPSLGGRRKTLPMKEQNRSALKEEQWRKFCFCFPSSRPPAPPPSPDHSPLPYTPTHTLFCDHSFFFHLALGREKRNSGLLPPARLPLISGAAFQSFHGSLFEYHLWNGNLSVKHETEGEERGGFGCGKGGRPSFNY